jgi:hydrogenase maturation protease
MNSENLMGPGPASEKLLIGVGNEFRSDDGVGPYLSGEIRKLGLEGIEVIEAGGEGAELVGLWDGLPLVIIIDAVYSGNAPGTIYLYQIPDDKLPTAIFGRHSTHAFGLAEAVELSRTMGTLPKKLIIYGIEGKTFEPGPGLSNEVRKAADGLKERIVADIYNPRE